MSETGEYFSKLRNWGLYVLAILVATVLQALVLKWTGAPVTLPPPPGIAAESCPCACDCKP